jgi:hypothetical protein
MWNTGVLLLRQIRGVMNVKVSFWIMKVLLLVITVILLLAVAAQAIIALTYNKNLTKNYSHNTEAYDYKEALIDGSIDVKELEKLFPSIESAFGYNLTNVISTPITIHYYNSIGDQSPAYVIDKGKRIHVKKDINSLSAVVGYGLDSMPTDVSGWRIAYPFTTDTGMSNELLYVRLDELFDVACSWVNANEFLVKMARLSLINTDEILAKRVYQRMRLTRDNTIREFTLIVDHRLYDNGVYLSPDLFGPVFPVSSLIMLVLAILVAGIWVFLGVTSKWT